jgi:hypothetical protein
MSLDATAGAKGEQAVAWERFTEDALNLLRRGEEPYTLVLHLTRCIEHHYGEEV